MELSIERSEESFKQPEIIKSEDFVQQQQQVEEEVVESSEIKIPVEKIEETDETPIVTNLQENIVTEQNSLNEIIPVTLENETGLDCSSLSPTCGQGLDIVNVVSLKMEDFNKLDDQTDVLDISDEPGQNVEIEIEGEEEPGYEEEILYDEDESETEEQSFPVRNLDTSTIVLDDDDDDEGLDDEGVDDVVEEEEEEEEGEDEDEDDDSDSEIEEEDSDIEEIQSSLIKKNPNDYDPMEGTSSNIQGDWDRWRIKRKKELEEAALIEAIPIITMKPRRRTFLQRIKKRSIKW